MFPHNEAAEEWFIQQRWSGGVCCPHCGSLNVQTGAQHKTMPFRCREKVCGKRFSTKTGTVMEASKVGYQDWLISMFLMGTGLKGVSSMKLHRDLDVNQRTAWFIAHRIRKALSGNGEAFLGPIEVDETYMGGKRKNMPNHVRKELTGRGAVGKTAVAGAKDRASNSVAAKVVTSTDKETLQGFVKDCADAQASVYTDDASAYDALPFEHESVQHSVSEYVRGQAHTNGVESFWSMLKRGYIGTLHELSPKHLDRYVQEFAGRHNIREQDTMRQLELMRSGMERKRLRYRELIADNGLDSGARAAA